MIYDLNEIYLLFSGSVVCFVFKIGKDDFDITQEKNCFD